MQGAPHAARGFVATLGKGERPFPTGRASPRTAWGTLKCKEFVRQDTRQSNEATLTESPLVGARILVFSKTAAFRHGSIGAGRALFSRLATEHGFAVEFTESQGLFSDRFLDPFDAIVFLNTTGDVLDDRRQRAMERFIQSGRGYIGIHAAADTERDDAWPWYIRLVGGAFAGHPGDPSHIQRARLHVAPPSDPSTEHFPAIFDFVDEWYDFASLRVQTQTLLHIDRDSYPGSQHSGLTKIAWQQEFDGGRAFYTTMGHRDETYSDEGFIKHLLGGIEFAVGDKARQPLSEQRPDPERFTVEVLTQPLNEPVSLDVLSDGSVLIVERRGKLKKWVPSGETLVIGEVPDIYYPGENSEFGLLAIAGVEDAEGLLQGAYFMANRKTEGQVSQHVSYAPLTEGRMDFSSSRLIIEFPIDDTCCHTGGSIRSGPDGALYIGVGDNSNPHRLGGYAPLSRDEVVRDARRSAGDTMDLRGKILRILPSPSGSYEVPEGNLFADADEGRPEIYVMGARNPYTIGFDWDTGDLYYGDVGPDAHLDDPARGSKGFDEVNRVTRAGNFGWPFFIGDNYPYRIIDEETGEP